MSTGVSTERRTLAVRLITPEGTAYEGNVLMVVAPSVGGEVGIMPRHAPLIAQLKVGTVRFKVDDETSVVFATTTGYLSIVDNKVLIMVAQAENVADLDRGRAEAGVQAAEEALASAGDDSTAKINAEHRLRRNQNRVKAIEKYGAGS